MTSRALGRLEKVDIRAVWKNEASDFTPWLAEPENLELLGDTIGIELEVDSVEKAVGPFFADILCKEMTSDRYVVIENQIEQTDHDHLGKTITYASGLGATAVVWIAKHIRDEHRAALDWLNEITNSDVAFFGLEIEVWHIGDSAPAPKFNVVCRPNDFTPTVQPEPGSMSPLSQARLEFWLSYKEFLEETTDLKCSKPSSNPWVNHPAGRSGLWLSSTVSTWDSVTGTQVTGELRIDLSIDDGHVEATLEALRSQRQEIDAELAALIPEQLTWYRKEGVRSARLFVRVDADIMQRERWPEYREWLGSRLAAFDGVFRPRIADLKVGTE
jgi:hypothetical protein